MKPAPALKIFVFFLFLIAAKFTNAQVIIRVIEPMPGPLTLGNIFHVEILNTSSESKEIRLKGAIAIDNNKAIYSVTFKPIVANPGASQITSTLLTVENFQFSGDERAKIVQQQGLFPVGNYVICMQAFDPSNAMLLSDGCVEHTVTALTPPFLMSPSNQSHIHTLNPLLLWIPPSPLTGLLDVNYDLKLVEVLPNQSGYEAIQRNYALFQQRGIKFNNLVYPPTAGLLQWDKTYAWQITARSGGYIIGSTEIWTFTPKVDSLAEAEMQKQTLGSYAELKPALDGSFTLALPELRFAYFNDYTPENLNFRILDLQGKERIFSDVNLTSKYGDNKYVIDLKQLGKFKNGQYYILEVTTPSKEKRLLMFCYFESIKSYQKKNN